MGTLRDEVYENLDYLSQLTEVVIGPQNEVLGRAPDRAELTFEQVNKVKSRVWGQPGFTLDVSQVLIALLPQPDWTYISDIRQHFKFEVSDDFELDIAHQKMTGIVTLVKTVQQVDEKQILEMALDKAFRFIVHYDWPAKRLRDKIVTVLNTFEQGKGTEWAKNLSGKVGRSGEQTIRATLSEVILENKWRVRDVNIILKIGQWINSYLCDETEQDMGLVNLLMR